MMGPEFKVVNIVAVQNTGFHIDLVKLNETGLLTEYEGTFRIYYHIKIPDATRPVTVFYNGNLICVGNKTVAEARRNLEAAKNYLKKFRLKS